MPWLLILLAVGLRAAHFHPVGYSDSGRFLDQAASLRAGHGLYRGNDPVTNLPPGYPVFIAALLSLYDSQTMVYGAQFLMSVLACWLVYLAIRPRSEGFARLALLGMAVHPLLVRWPRALMSETLGVFLAAMCVWVLSRIASSERRQPLLFYFLGLLLLALPLTVPFTIFLAAGVWLAVAIRSPRDPRSVLLMTAGSLVLFIPWQMYCYSTAGRFAPFLFHHYPHAQHDVSRWMRTWVYSPDEKALLWGRHSVYTIEMVPEAAFDSPEDRALAVARWGSIRTPDPEVARLLQRTTERRLRQQPLEYRWIPMAFRGLLLWFDPGRSLRRLPTFETGGYISDFHNVSADYLVHLQPSRIREDLHARGLRRAMVTLAFALNAALITGVYVLCAAFFLMLAVRVLGRPQWIAWAIVLGTLAYVFFSALDAGPTVRRNQPFYPCLFFLLYYLPPSYTTIADLFPLAGFRSAKKID